MNIANDIKPKIMVANESKPNLPVWKDVKTPHYRTLSAGMPIGILLTLTYNIDVVILTNE